MNSPYPRADSEFLTPLRRLVAAVAAMAAAIPAVFFAEGSASSPPSRLAILTAPFVIVILLVCWCVATAALRHFSPLLVCWLTLVALICVYFATAEWPFQLRFRTALPALTRLTG